MESKNKKLADWLEDIKRGVVQLPRFQRKEAWNHDHVKNFLETVIFHDRPMGILLTLDVDPNNQPFVTRPLEGIDNITEECKTHLLDGQQRLTALWKSLNDKYDDRLYFIKFKVEGEQYICDSIESIIRKNNPWVDNSEEVINRNYIPISILYPKDALDR